MTNKDVLDTRAIEAWQLVPAPITVTFDLTEGMLFSQVISAIESSYGSRHWASINVGEHLPGWRNYLTAKFQDMDNDEVYELSIDKLKAGVAILAKKYPMKFAEILTETGDASTGDALVQCALLGDIVYT